jgi:hypothetical protein
MKQFRVTVTNGSCNAPSLYVSADKIENAEKEAREKSGLGRFNSWAFIPREIPQRTFKK